MTASLPSGAVAEERIRPVTFDAVEDLPRAPNQHPQPLYFPSNISVYKSPRVEDVFEGDVFTEPEFLPPEAYGEPSPARGGHSLQIAQYPFHDSAARDFDPEGRYETPRWNPVFIPEDDLSDLPGSPWLGLATKERSLTFSVLPGSGDSLGMTSLDLRTTIFPVRLPILMFSPRFSWHFLGGPTTTDLPARLYEVALETQLFIPLNDRWSMLGGIAPSLFSDFDNLSGDALRITGHGIVFYKWSETTKLAAGFLYLDRNDVTALPLVGLIYKPGAGYGQSNLKVEIMFPKPRVAYRFRQNGDREWWGYLAGEFGGGTWAIERASGANDMVTYRDFRLIAGVEQVRGDAFRWLLEAGYVFGREIEYESKLGNMEIRDAALIRFGFVY